ncbi:MAG: ATP phosphoribosyltransferase [Planctomycetota bacterium]|nr:ATP phosphoribosyltransferase [Planctomycetota bacterium]
MSNLRIGIPSKGRLADRISDLLAQAGLSFRRQDRALFARVQGMPIDITFLRTDDIPLLCARGAIDLGITGSDLVAESGAELLTRLPLGIGRCRMVICVPEESPITQVSDLAGTSIASSFPTITRNFLADHGCEAQIIPLHGSVEIMISLGVAEAIVDLTETGSTLAANKLRILEEIDRYESVVIQNQASREAELADLVIRRLEGVVVARAYSLLEYNVARSKLSEAEQITPGFHSPTVNPLEDPDWCAVRVMVKRGDVTETMDKLDNLGATAILETQIHNSRL